MCIRDRSSTVNFTTIDRFREDLKTKAFLKSVNEKNKEVYSFFRCFRGFLETTLIEWIKNSQKIWINCGFVFYMRGERNEKESRKNDLIDRGAVHPEPCRMRLWKDGGSSGCRGTADVSRLSLIHI